MGSPIAPVVTNIFMEEFERKALENSPYKPKRWWRYVDDVFAVVADSDVNPLLAYLNELHPKIKFTIEKESEGALPFLDELVMRDQNGHLSHKVYRKATHTDRYLQAGSHLHPAHLSSVPRALINRALRLCDPQYLQGELRHVRHVLERNGYGWRQSQRQIRNVLRSPKDKDPLGNPGVYEIPCDCGKSYIGETGRNVSTRLLEHIRSVKKMECSNSAVAEHALDTVCVTAKNGARAHARGVTTRL
ncbi:uncharacterized protein LOC134747923 [Cydia strobilella]|uniref:uncharacterized protein LOC134747923 n=1 Tax=Cydia strobilella TaxID=1100964 RepID=UPI003004AE41